MVCSLPLAAKAESPGSRTRVLVPDEDVGQDGDELADVADDGHGRGRHRLAQLPREEVHREAHPAADAQRPQSGRRQLRRSEVLDQ